MSVLLSNRLESLYERLRDDLGTDLFADQRVVVPNYAMKQWLQKKLAEDHGVATGIDFSFLEEAIHSGRPSKLELSLRLQQRLPLIDELSSYLRSWRRIASLADVLAELFLQYDLYGEVAGDDWQTRLYREVMPQWDANVKPLYIFGFSFLPPRYFHLLTDSHLYLLSPCAAYWGDIVSDREGRRLADYWRRQGAYNVDQLEEYLTDRHSLLANLGRVGRQFSLLLEDLHFDELYEESDPSALGELQNGMLLLEDRQIEPDTTLEIHEAPSPIHEVEALKEAICASGIKPEEILVMTPKIDTYAPLVEASFSRDGIPFVLQAPSEVHIEFLRLLDLVEGRWELSTLLPILDRLGLETTLLRSAPIGWGRDLSHRDQVMEKLYGRALSDRSGVATWEEGLGSLIDGLATGETELSSADQIEALLLALQEIEEDLAPLREAADLSVWADRLEGLAEKYCEPIEALGKLRIPLEGHFEFGPIRRAVEKVLNVGHGTMPLSYDAIRCSSMVPVPAKMICLLGFDEESFPSRHRPLSLDKMAGKTPTKSDLDRYLFLETILAARERLVIFYSNRSERDGQPLGPSPLLDDLDAKRVVHQAYREPGVERAPLRLTQPMPLAIDLRDLRLSASDPAKLFLRSILGITLEEEEDLSDEESLTFDGLELYRILLDGTFDPEDLPPGLFGEVEKRRVEKRLTEVREGLAQLGIKELRGQEVSLEVEVEGQTVRIEGELPLVSEKGIVLLGRQDVATLIRNWPLLLVHGAKEGKSAALFARGAKEVVIEQPLEQLKKYLTYYLRSTQQLMAPHSKLAGFASPYMEWGEGLVDESPFEPALEAWRESL